MRIYIPYIIDHNDISKTNRLYINSESGLIPEVGSNIVVNTIVSAGRSYSHRSNHEVQITFKVLSRDYESVHSFYNDNNNLEVVRLNCNVVKVDYKKTNGIIIKSLTNIKKDY
jgi:superfamily II helicase